MPVYEYEGNICNERFQAFLLQGEDDRAMSCPKCNEKNVKKVSSLCSADSDQPPSSGCKTSGST